MCMLQMSVTSFFPLANTETSDSLLKRKARNQPPVAWTGLWIFKCIMEILIQLYGTKFKREKTARISQCVEDKKTL